jgi:hypothetical protein
MQLNTLLAALHRERLEFSLERAAQKGALLTNENTKKKEEKKATDVKVAELSSHPVSDCEVQGDVNAKNVEIAVEESILNSPKAKISKGSILSMFLKVPKKKQRGSPDGRGARAVRCRLGTSQEQVELKRATEAAIQAALQTWGCTSAVLSKRREGAFGRKTQEYKWDERCVNLIQTTLTRAGADITTRKTDHACLLGWEVVSFLSSSPGRRVRNQGVFQEL